MDEQKIVIVLGMHRSGTSMVAGILHKLGVFMGDKKNDRLMIGSMPEQPAGYYEDRDFMGINQEIFTACGAGWDNPPEPGAIWRIVTSGQFDEKIKKNIEARKDYPAWGWKDPRTCLTLPIYLHVLQPIVPKIIVVHREKGAVVRSLEKREYRKDWDECEQIYDTYMDCVRQYTNDHWLLNVQYEDLIGYKDITSIVHYLEILPTPEQVGRAVLHIQPELNRQGVELR